MFLHVWRQLNVLLPWPVLSRYLWVVWLHIKFASIINHTHFKDALWKPNWPSMILLAFNFTNTPNSFPLPFAGRSLFSDFLQVSAHLNLLALNQFVLNFWKRWQIKRWRVRNWVSLTSHFTVTSTEVASLKRKAENTGNELERRGPNSFSELQPSTSHSSGTYKKATLSVWLYYPAL